MPRINAVERDTRALWLRIKAIAETGTLSPQRRQEAAITQAEEFIVNAQSTGDEARTMAGCIIEAKITGLSPESFLRNVDELPFSVSHVAPELTRKLGKRIQESDGIGISVVLRDFLEHRYREHYSPGTAKFVTNMLSEVVMDRSLQRRFTTVAQEHHCNPFADLNIAVVGAGMHWWNSFFSMRQMFHSCEAYHAENLLTASNASERSGHFDYVVTADVVSDPKSHTRAIMQDTTTITKPGGKIIHICVHSPVVPTVDRLARQIPEIELHSVDLSRTRDGRRIRATMEEEHRGSLWSEIVIYQKRGNELVMQPAFDQPAVENLRT